MLEPNAFWLYYKGILNICYPTSDLKTPMLANLIVSRAAYFEVVVYMYPRSLFLYWGPSRPLGSQQPEKNPESQNPMYIP